MSYYEDPDDDGQDIRDQRLEEQAELDAAIDRHPAGSQR